MKMKQKLKLGLRFKGVGYRCLGQQEIIKKFYENIPKIYKTKYKMQWKCNEHAMKMQQQPKLWCKGQSVGNRCLGKAIGCIKMKRKK